MIYCVTFSQNSYNEDGLKTGNWVGYYDSGELRYQGYFQDGKEYGLFTYYYKSGNVDTELFYSVPGRSAKARIYYSSGHIKALGVYCGKIRCDLWEFFDNTGNIMSKEYYVDGDLHGDVIYYINGKMVESFEYVQNQKHGVSFTFYDSGAIKTMSKYRKDKLHGEFSFFDRKGNLIEKGVYGDGFRQGEWIVYKNNQKISSSFYENGQLIYEKK